MINSDYFFMSQAGHARALIRGWSGLRRRSLLTDDGLDLLVEITVAVGKVNQMSAQVRRRRCCACIRAPVCAYPCPRLLPGATTSGHYPGTV